MSHGCQCCKVTACIISDQSHEFHVNRSLWAENIYRKIRSTLNCIKLLYDVMQEVACLEVMLNRKLRSYSI